MAAQKPFSLLGVPIDCIGLPGGTELGPLALRNAGIAGAIGASCDLGDVETRMTGGPERDMATGIIAFDSLVDMTRDVRQRVAGVLAGGGRPFLVGGCCSFMMGAIAGAADNAGKVGLAYIDGHMDLYDGKTSPGGEAADMPLALMLGYAPSALADATGGRQRVLAQNVVLLGYRDISTATAAGSMMPDDMGGDFFHRDAASIQREGAEAAALAARNQLEQRVGSFWLHLDFDVLDETVFPAVDYLMPNGLDRQQLVSLLRPLAASPGLVGMSVACYNPELDKSGADARLAVDILRDIFA